MPSAIAQGLIWGIMAIGVYITFRILDIADLTVDGTVCTGAAVCAVLVVSGVNVWLALLIATIAGIIAGCVTWFFHVVLGIPAILAGILTQLMLWSVNLKIMSGANVAVPSRTFQVLLTQMNVPMALVFLGITAVVIIALLYLFFGTEIGCTIRATGNNIAMSRAQGINTNLTKLIGLALSNGIVALSGAILCQYQGFSDINMGKGAIVTGLASVIIGEAVIRKIGKNFAVKLAGVFVGSVIYWIVYQTVVFFKLDTDLLKMLSALLVAIFLGVPYIKKKLGKKGGTQTCSNSCTFDLEKINKRDLATSIILSVITFGGYLIYWEYLLVKNIRTIRNDSSSCVREMLCLIFVPFYSIYWLYTRGKVIRANFEKNGFVTSGHEIAYLILGIFGLEIISFAIMQNDFNSLPDRNPYRHNSSENNYVVSNSLPLSKVNEKEGTPNE